MNLPVANLRCLRDPNFEKHEWHAGHIDRIKLPTPRENYENRQRGKRAGKKAFSIIRFMEHYWKMSLSSTQKHILYICIRDELFFLSKNPESL